MITPANLLGPPRWAIMWSLALGIFGAAKVLTWRQRSVTAPIWKHAAYLIAWPGMDVNSFLTGRPLSAPRLGDWMFALSKMAVGLALLLAVVPVLPEDQSYLLGWTGMWGIVFLLHFGLFDLMACVWQRVGLRAVAIMNWPVASQSLAEFWGRRWNLAFRDLTARYIFRPLASDRGAVVAMLAGFIASGLIHDLIISVPAGGGYGLPTIYFVIQGLALLIERSRAGRALGLGRGLRGRLAALLVVVLPCPLLFHPWFVCGVMHPFLRWLGLTS